MTDFKNNFKYCTLTGVDDHTNLSQLENIAKRYEFSEWGFLYSLNNNQETRYPNVFNIKKALFSLDKNIHLSIHYCGKTVTELLTNEKSEARNLFSIIASRKGRIQLNFNYLRKEPLIDLSLLENFISKSPIKIIIQYNKNNAIVMQKLKHLKNIQFLLDESGGNGIERQNWPNSPDDIDFGYAGGINNQNIENVLLNIEKNYKLNDQFKTWIDMESSLRVEDKFDLTISEEILKKITNFLKQENNLKLK